MTKCLNSAGVDMPRFYVATYGDLGLEIEFYFDPLRYGRDIRKAEREHANQKLDTYTYGTIPSMPAASPKGR